MAYYKHYLPTYVEHQPAMLEQGIINDLQQIWDKKFVAYHYLYQRYRNERNLISFKFEERLEGQPHPPNVYLIEVHQSTQVPGSYTSNVLGYLFLSDLEIEKNQEFLDENHDLLEIYGSNLHNDVLLELAS